MLLRLIGRPRLVDDDDTVDRVARIRLGGDEGKRLVAAGGQRLVAVAAVGRRLRVRDRRDRFVKCNSWVLQWYDQAVRTQNLSHFGVEISG